MWLAEACPGNRSAFQGRPFTRYICLPPFALIPNQTSCPQPVRPAGGQDPAWLQYSEAEFVTERSSSCACEMTVYCVPNGAYSSS